VVFSSLFGIGDLSREKFAALYAKLGKKLGVFTDPQVDMDAFAVVEGDMVHNLGNIYPQFIQMKRKHRRGFLTHVLVGWKEAQEEGAIPESWEEARDMLVPRFRDATYLSVVDIESKRREAPEMRSAYTEFAPGLFLTLVVDAERTMANVSNSMLEDWGVSLDEAREVAEKNLLNHSHDGFEMIAAGVWVSTWEDSYAASRLVLPHIIQQVTTDPVVCVPNRDLIIVCEPRKPAALETMVAILEKVAETESYALTRRLYQLEGTEYSLFEFPEDSPAADVYRNLRIIEDANCYEQQKESLQDLLGEDLFVASISVYENEENGVLHTGSVWTQTVPSLLPRTEVIHFLQLDETGEGAQAAWVVPWSKVIELGVLERNDDPLPRWRTGEFPSAETLDEIGERVK
jgi:hypothetical protein